MSSERVSDEMQARAEALCAAFEDGRYSILEFQHRLESVTKSYDAPAESEAAFREIINDLELVLYTRIESQQREATLEVIGRLRQLLHVLGSGVRP